MEQPSDDTQDMGWQHPAWAPWWDWGETLEGIGRAKYSIVGYNGYPTMEYFALQVKAAGERRVRNSGGKL